MSLPLLRAEIAIMNILRAQKLPELGAIDLQQIKDAWGDYGLRQRDLPPALDRLEALGLVEIDVARGKRKVILTETGSRWVHSIANLITRALLLPRVLKQKLPHLGLRPGSTDHPSRRRNDRPRGET